MLEITPISAFADNYIWALRHPPDPRVAVVDPGDEEPVLAYLAEENLRLGAILITHHHGDHTGGIGGLLEAYPSVPVYGPAGERIPGITHRLREGDRIRPPGFERELLVLDLPGHTAGHIGYLGDGALFCGDTLFAAGCGRVFGGTLQDLHASLQRLAGLPANTRVYCAHEYTLDNLGFARWVEPDSTALDAREAAERAKLAAGQPTVPSLLGDELASNPFLRTAIPEVRHAAEAYAGRPLSSEAEVFAALRTWKDKKYD